MRVFFWIRECAVIPGGWLSFCALLIAPFSLKAQPVFFVHEGELIRFHADDGQSVKLAAPAQDVAIGEFLGVVEGNRPIVKLAPEGKRPGDYGADHGHDHENDPSLADIAILGADGRIEQVLAENAFRAFPSPSGSKIALIDADYSIHVIEGGSRRMLDVAERTVLAAWSPDETQLCLTVYPPDWRFNSASTAEGPDEFLRLINNDLFLYDLQTDSGERLTHYTGYDYGGIFSPDGKEILFISSRAGRGAFYTLDIETRDIRQVTNLEPESYDIPVARSQTMVWLPKMNGIAYEAQETPELSSIRTVKADGTSPRNLGIGLQPRVVNGGAGVAFLDEAGTPRLRTLEADEP